MFPTMIACCFRSADAMTIVAQEVSLVHFASFLTEKLNEFKQQEDTLINDPDKGNNLRADRWLLHHRFPVKYAKQFDICAKSSQKIKFSRKTCVRKTFALKIAKKMC